MVYSHWLSPGPGMMGYLVLCRTFHTAPEQGERKMGYMPIFHILKLFQEGVFQLYFKGSQVSMPGLRHS